MPTWPATLPQQPNGNDGKYKETPPETTIRDKNEVGPDTVRRRAVAGVRKVTLPFRFAPEEVDIFDAWFRTELKDGALSFTMTWPPPPRSGTSVNMRFLNAPTYEHQGAGVCDTSLELEILP